MISETPNPGDSVETSNAQDPVSVIQQPLVSLDRSADRTASQSAGDRTESFGDKNETTLKRVAEKIINYEMTPVAQALARHLGIDLSNDGAQARNRRGIAIIIHGPPGSGKTMISRELSQRYSCALLNLDQVIIDAIDSAQRNEYAQRAYNMCRDAMEKYQEEQRATETDVDHTAPTQLGKKQKSFSNFVNKFCLCFSRRCTSEKDSR